MVNKCGEGGGWGLSGTVLPFSYTTLSASGLEYIFFEMHSLVALFHVEFIRYKIMQSYDFSHKWGKAFEFDIR